MDIVTLATKRLLLRPFEESDIDTLHALFGEEGVLRYFPSSEPPSWESVQRQVKAQEAHWRQRGYGLWAVTRRRDGRLMGRSGLQYLPNTREVEVDFLLGKRFWGQGYATEAGTAGLRFGFEQLGLDEIVGIVHPENKASRRVLEKLGMRLTAQTRYFGMDVYRYAVQRAWFEGLTESRL
jgi:RimJ/RimL family protein N-acetyltransferase